MVNAHATSTPTGDTAEALAIRTAIGDHALVTAPKSMLGHLLGAAGAVETIATVLSVRDGIVPMTRNLEDLDDGVELDVVSVEAKRVPVPVAVNDAFGFGGHNVALVVTRI
jgi:3-oxoacyl-[acyl-carrier-protein] synthase II